MKRKTISEVGSGLVFCFFKYFYKADLIGCLVSLVYSRDWIFWELEKEREREVGVMGIYCSLF